MNMTTNNDRRRAYDIGKRDALGGLKYRQSASMGTWIRAQCLDNYDCGWIHGREERDVVALEPDLMRERMRDMLRDCSLAQHQAE